MENYQREKYYRPILPKEAIALPRAVRTAVIDVGKGCQARCDFCYYVWNSDYKGFDNYNGLCEQAIRAKDRGNTLIELTGGEPTIMPKIDEYIKFIHSIGLKVCIITNALAHEARMQKIIDAQIDLFRVSMHGMEKIHDTIVNVKDARKKQERFLRLLNKNDVPFHVNYVISNKTQNDIKDFTDYIIQFKPKQIAFINFNPHYEWGKEERATTITANLIEVEPVLNNAIDIFESNDIGVNVRYYPMCRIREDLRKNICNDLHVMFDPWEWDYEVMPKTLTNYFNFGKHLSNSNEEKGLPCCNCSIHKVCGGINVAFNKATHATMVNAIIDNKKYEEKDFYIYRKFNTKTLVMPWKKI